MSEEEKEYLLTKLKDIKLNDIEISNHLMKKDPNFVSFNQQDIFNVLSCDDLIYLIIEYNETPLKNETTDFRVLLRDKHTKQVEFTTPGNIKFKANANMCFVISLKSFRIITLYWNIVDDNHSSINWNRYNENLNIIKK